jgi:anti-sigma factor RsiW
MRCNDTQQLIGAYIDGELDLVRSLDIEGHLHECSLCSREYESYRALHGAIRDGDFYFDTPAGLEKRIRTGLRRANESQARLSLPSWRWLFAGAAAAATAMVVLSIALIFNGNRARTLLVQDLVSSHIRSLQNHLIDVPSSDQHTVKPWFNGKVDFSPPVKDLSDVGFHLEGGRLDYVDNRPVAVVVYSRRQHYINLYIWPSNANAGTGANIIDEAQRQGYNMLHWTSRGMTFWAISDLNPAELHDFVRSQQD